MEQAAQDVSDDLHLGARGRDYKKFLATNVGMAALALVSLALILLVSAAIMAMQQAGRGAAAPAPKNPNSFVGYHFAWNYKPDPKYSFYAWMEPLPARPSTVAKITVTGLVTDMKEDQGNIDKQSILVSINGGNANVMALQKPSQNDRGSGLRLFEISMFLPPQSATLEFTVSGFAPQPVKVGPWKVKVFDDIGSAR